MKILWYEMKKIWNWKIITLLLIITTIFYQLFLYYPIEEFRSNHPHIESHDFAVEMVERYGHTITEDELKSFVSEKQAIYELELDTYFDVLPVLKDAGISNYEEYQQLKQKEGITEAEFEAIWSMSNEETNYVVFKLQTLHSMLHDADNPEGSNSILSWYMLESTMDYIRNLAILIILLTLILVSPLVRNDRALNLHFLQYTSKNGRKLFRQQKAAVLLSTFILTTICIVGFGGLISQNDLAIFWGSPLDSFLVPGEPPLFPVTFGEYISLAVLLLYPLSMGVALMAFVFSRYSENIITMIMKLLPVFAGFVVFSNFIFGRLFYSYNRFYGLTNIAGIEGGLILSVLLLMVTISIIAVKREKQIDII